MVNSVTDKNARATIRGFNLLLEDLLELAGDVGGVTVHDGRVAVLDFPGVVQNNHLSAKLPRKPLT